MNERIDKIRIEAAEWMKMQGYPLEYRSTWEKQCDEKFAELIVNQCASIVSLYRRDNMQDKAVADTLESAYREIKLSFGLKP